MENLSDVDEVPPTPNIQPNKLCSKIDKTKKLSKLSRKHHNNDQNNMKRKRIISPDFKKVKQKAKQATLYSFFVNKNCTDSSSSISSSLYLPVKINLLDKFEKCNNKVENIQSIPNFTSECNIYSNSLTSNVCRKKVSDQIDAVPQVNCKGHENLLHEEYIISNNLKSNVTISNETASTSLPSRTFEKDKDNKTTVIKFDSPNENTSLSIENNSCDTTLQCENASEEQNDIDQTFSWMNEDIWEKDKENINLNYDFSALDISNDHVLNEPEFGESSMKFKVIDVQKYASKNEIKLLVSPIDDSTCMKTCYLRGFWADSIVNKGDIVHIIKPSNGAIIDNNSGFLVINPDFLISSTAVVSTLFCMRKAVLNYTLPQWSPGNNIMMIGSLVHDVFQQSVNNHVYTHEDVLKIIKMVMKKRENLIALCCQDMSETEIEEKICKFIPNLTDWIKKHCKFEGIQPMENICITNVEDIEENIWCPKYGVKGKIDLTVNVQFKNEVSSKLMPLELKTGRPTYSAEHIGQVNLYSLMMEERSKEVSDGLLLYLREKAEMKVITTNHNSKRGLIQLRNELTSFIYKWVSTTNSAYEDIEECHLPKPINNKRLCEKCPYLLPCTIYQKAFKEDLSLETGHAMTTLIPSAIKHLEPNHIKYFLHWSRLLLLEHTTTAEVKAFWTENAIMRENKGLCLSNVLLDENVAVKQESFGGYFIHTFIRSDNNPVSTHFKNSCLKEGDYIAISNQNNPDEVAVAMGYIIAVCDKFIEIAIERNLQKISRLKGIIFRIDKIISNSAAACVRNNLMLLMQDELQAGKLRKLVIDKEPPKFLQALPKQIVLLGREILKPLNKIQQKAVLKAIMAEDFFLIKGMPGTGKTSTIFALVRLLVKMNKSVLLASYTHSAVDNILLKLKGFVEFVRIGPSYRIHPAIMEYSFENLTKKFSSTHEFSTFMKEKMIVATTCLGINHAIFKLRKFDICIVDEASQINQIACLGPIFFAKKFILVGDDKQLPPLVLNNEARQKGMQESLFQRLQNPDTTMELTLQYRMNKEIMKLCNKLTYNGVLQCGSPEVANAVLQIDLVPTSEIFPSWLTCALDSDITKSVIFLNVDHYLKGQEYTKSDVEAEIVSLILKFLIQNNVLESNIGIIAPYRKQVDVIEIKLKSLNIRKVEVNTVDQYQGRDKEIIIISCVRPNDDNQQNAEKAGVILNDEKRLNVAITRAKKKLILIGSKTTLSEYKAFKHLLTCLKEHQFVDIT